MSGASGGSTHAPTRCLYAALNVPRTASATDIKKAYRKEALVWHPDKNVGNVAEAHVRFQELQHAYAVLSDPQERRWYDDHRDEILHPERYARGDDDSDGDGGHGRTVNLTKYFSAMAFSGFGDDESGFYQTYNRAFQDIWDAEKEWGNSDALDGGGGGEHGWGEGEAPELGGSKDSFEVADAFYSKWSGFVSSLSFGWEDEYNLNEADNRRVRRLMDKENNKKRAAARRKYHDDVRALVDFCRRRDKRVIKHKLQLAKEKEARERKRREEAEAQKVETEHRRLEWLRNRQAEEKAEEEARARDGEAAVFRVGETDDEEDVEVNETGGRRKGRRRKGGKHGKGSKGRDESTLTVFRCAVCKKDFKSKGQMANHETSKAHRKKMEELDAQMIRESLLEGHESEVEGEDESGGSSSREEQGGMEGGEDVDEEHQGGGKGKDADDFEADDFFMEDALRELHLEIELERQGLSAPDGGDGMPSVDSSVGPSMEPGVEQEGDDKLWGEADVSIDAFLFAHERRTHGFDGEGPAARSGLGGSRTKNSGSDSSTSDEDDDDSDDDDDDDDDGGIGVLAARTGKAGADTESSDDEADEDALEGSRDARAVNAAKAQWDVRKPRGKANANRRNRGVRVAEDSDDSGDGNDGDRGRIDLVEDNKRGLLKGKNQNTGADPASFGDDDGDGDNGDRGDENNVEASVGRGARRRRRQALKATKATGEGQIRKGKRGGARLQEKNSPG